MKAHWSSLLSVLAATVFPVMAEAAGEPSVEQPSPPALAHLARDFARPRAEWKSRPLWFWNGPLDQARTTEIMEQSVASGYHGFGILPTERH